MDPPSYQQANDKESAENESSALHPLNSAPSINSLPSKF